MDFASIFATEQTVGAGDTNIFNDIIAGGSQLLKDYWANERADDQMSFQQDLVRAGLAQPNAYTSGPYAMTGAGYAPVGMTTFEKASIVIALAGVVVVVIQLFRR